MIRGSLLRGGDQRVCVAACNCCGVAGPERSSICILNPPACPMPRTGGGGKTSAKAFLDLAELRR